jgi:hypothetical protein
MDIEVVCESNVERKTTVSDTKLQYSTLGYTPQGVASTIVAEIGNFDDSSKDVQKIK